MKIAVRSIGLGLTLACLTFLSLPKLAHAQHLSQVRKVVRQNGNSTELVRIESQDKSTTSVRPKPEFQFGPEKFANLAPAAPNAELTTLPAPQKSDFDSRPEKRDTSADVQQLQKKNASPRPELVRKADYPGGSDEVVTPK